MASIDSYLDGLLARGRAYFSREELAAALGLKRSALAAAITRAINKRRLANPRHGFYLILRPEDHVAGAPDPVKWIDPLMKHQGIDYRISLLRAAAFHGASHQASMVFQVVVPRQLRDFDLGRHRLQFLYQGPDAFSQVNQSSLVDQMKSDAGFATVAGVELTLLDCIRYFHKAAGINGVAQIVKDIGAKASPRLLQKAAGAYENSAVRRLGYLLDLAGHARQADALQGFVKRARTALPLDPAVRPLVKALAQAGERNPRWRLVINEAVEIASFEPEELFGTKLRALLQRRRNRDLFDLHQGLEQLPLAPEKVIACFDRFLALEGKPITRAMAEQRMLEKLTRSLTEDVAPMLPASVRWSDEDAIQAFERVWTELIARIRGDTWKLSDAVIEELRANRYPALLMPRHRKQPQ